VNPADAPILILSLTSKTLPLAQTYDTANTILAQKIAQVQGVGQVFVGGGQNPAVRVQVDPAVLAGLGLGLEDVRTVLSQATVDQPKGGLSGARQASTIAANDQLAGAKSFRALIISYKGNAAVRLGDVAQVMDDVENNRVAAWTNGTRSVSLLIRRQPGANIIEVIDRIKRMLPSLAESVSPPSTSRWRSTALAPSRISARRGTHLAYQRISRRAGGLRISAQFSRHCNSKRRGSAFVGGHFCGHVPARL